jgi:hypothetical protein
MHIQLVNSSAPAQHQDMCEGEGRLIFIAILLLLPLLLPHARPGVAVCPSLPLLLHLLLLLLLSAGWAAAAAGASEHSLHCTQRLVRQTAAHHSTNRLSHAMSTIPNGRAAASQPFMPPLIHTGTLHHMPPPLVMAESVCMHGLLLPSAA